MNKLKLFYYSPSVPSSETSLFFSTPPLYLNSYLRVHDPELADSIEWQKLHFLHLTQDQLAAKLNELDTDVLCITLYIWNQRETLAVIRGIKQLLKKDIKIIAGGPSTDVVRNKNFLAENPDIDYAVYSQGERAFRDVIAHLQGIQKLSMLTTKNVAWRQDDRTRITDFEFIRLEQISPYLISSDLIKQTINDPDYKNFTFTLPYETSRGCPYNCSFCDWTSGLTHKTYFRKFDPEQELEVLGQLGLLYLHLSDANFGQHKNDVEVARTMVRLKKEKGYNFLIHNTNFSKLQKQRVFEIVDILLAGGVLHAIKFAVQDTHDFILENIERPDVPWTEHRKYIDAAHAKYPDSNFGVELIQGLPGQTRETWEKNFIDTQPYTPLIFYWTILPNSPAGYDQDYKKRMKLKSVLSDLPFVNEINSSNELRSETIIETLSYSTNDYAYMTLLSQIFSGMNLRRLMKGVDRQLVIELVKQQPNLDSVVNEIEKCILICNSSRINLIVMDFLKQIILANPKKFTNDFTKKFIKIMKGH